MNDGERDGRALSLFGLQWAIACLFHQAGARVVFDEEVVTHWGRNPIDLACTAAALYVIGRPSSTAALLSLCVLQVAAVFDEMPAVSNHWLFTGIASLTVVVAAVRVAVESRRTEGETPVAADRLYRTFAPLVRIELLVLYFFVVFHKLNTAFLSPETSCAVTQVHQLQGALPWLPTGHVVDLASIWMTLLIEAAIPVLLVLSRTRTAGIFLGALFHYVLGINEVFHFSAMLFACYGLFAPEDLPRAVQEWRSDRRLAGLLGHPWVARLRARVPAWLLGLVAFLVWALATGNTFTDPLSRFASVWKVYGLLWVGIVAWAVRSSTSPPRRARELLEPGARWLLLLPALCLLNGMCPYLGLKTASSFAMWSNLRTEAGQSNHLIVPPGRQLWSYQTDLVTIERASLPALQQLARRGRPIPLLTLRTIVGQARRSGARGIELTFVRAGKRTSLTRAERDPRVGRPPSFIEGKFLHFLSVQTSPQELCEQQ